LGYLATHEPFFLGGLDMIPLMPSFGTYIIQYRLTHFLEFRIRFHPFYLSQLIPL